MAIQEVTMYRVLCDGCGTSAQDGSDYYAWAGQAIDVASNNDWLVCDEERDEYVPKSETATGRSTH